MEMGTTNRRWLLNGRRSARLNRESSTDLLDAAEVLLTYREQLVAELDDLDRQLRSLKPAAPR
jgi:hypothetical protein